MNLTPKQRRRAVEVMAWPNADYACHHCDDNGNMLEATEFPTCGEHCQCRKLADAALTALLTVADVTMKENGDG